MAFQLMSVGLFGLGAYGFYRHSKKLQGNIDDMSLHPDQEKSAREYVLSITQTSTLSLGGDLAIALASMEWVTMPDTPTGTSGKNVIFASGYPSVSYDDLFKMNGLQVMQLCNRARMKPESSPMLFKLNSRRVVKPITDDLINAVKTALQKL